MGRNFFPSQRELFWVRFSHSSRYLDRISQLHSDGHLRVYISRELPFTAAGVREAFYQQRSRRTVGKIVLAIDPTLMRPTASARQIAVLSNRTEKEDTTDDTTAAKSGVVTGATTATAAGTDTCTDTGVDTPSSSTAKKEAVIEENEAKLDKKKKGWWRRGNRGDGEKKRYAGNGTTLTNAGNGYLKMK